MGEMSYKCLYDISTIALSLSRAPILIEKCTNPTLLFNLIKKSPISGEHFRVCPQSVVYVYRIPE